MNRVKIDGCHKKTIHSPLLGHMDNVLNDAFSPADSNVKIILHFRSQLTERYCSGIRRIEGNVSEGQGCSSVVEHTDGLPSECPWFNP